MASRRPYWFLIHLMLAQNVLTQLVPIGNGCFCQKPQIPQNQLINLQLPNPGCNCQNNLPITNLPINNLPINNFPVNLPVNGLQINNGLAFNRPPFANVPNFNVPIGNLPVVNNLPIYNNIPLANLPIFNNVPINNNLPINNLPLNGLQLNNIQIANRLPAFNNFGNNMPIRNNLPMPNNFIPNLPIPNNLPVNCLNNNGLPLNIPNCIQIQNQINQPFNNMPINMPNNRLQNVNVLPVNNLANNVQISNLPMNQPNNIQFANVPNGLQLNQLPNGVNNQQNFQNLPVNNDCGCNQPGLSVLVDNGLANSGNQANNAPVVSMNGLQLGGLGGLGNLPLFNGLPVIGVQESVVNLNPQCNCQN